MVNQELALHYGLRSDDCVEVGILGGDMVVRRPGWLARMVRESRPRWLQEVLLGAERWLPMALATVHTPAAYLRVSDHYLGAVIPPVCVFPGGCTVYEPTVPSWKCQMMAMGTSRYAALTAAGYHRWNSKMLSGTSSGSRRPAGGSPLEVDHRPTPSRPTRYASGCW